MAEAPQRLKRSTVVALAAMAMAVFVIANDVTALDESRASLAGGIVYMFQVAGGSIGLGLATTVFTEAVERGGFEDGFQWAFRLVAALALAALAVVLLYVGRAEDYASPDDDASGDAPSALASGSSP